MAKYDGTYKCGHEGTYNVYGPSKDRDRKAEWYFDTHYCPECQAKELAKEAEIAADRAKEKGLAELYGSEAQIAWALRIRDAVLSEVEKIEPINDEVKQIKERYYDGLAQERKASFFIENRDKLMHNYFVGEYLEKLKEREDMKLHVKAVEITREEKTEDIAVAPENCTHDGIVEIKHIVSEDGKQSSIRALYVKDEDFRLAIKELGFSWNKDNYCWEMKLDLFKGSPADRMAEVGNKLLNKGFRIAIADPETRAKAVHAEYKPLTDRWISTSPEHTHFNIMFKYDPALSEQVKKIQGARWNSEMKAYRVPAARFEEIQDLANIIGFELTPGAKELIKEQKGAMERITKVEPAKEKNAPKPGTAATIMNSSTDVLEDLMD